MTTITPQAALQLSPTVRALVERAVRELNLTRGRITPGGRLMFAPATAESLYEMVVMLIPTTCFILAESMPPGFKNADIDDALTAIRAPVLNTVRPARAMRYIATAMLALHIAAHLGVDK